MEDLIKLETEGIVFNVQGRGEVRFFGSISQFAGDCLTLLTFNEIFGLICSFSHGYSCTICYAEKISEHFVESSYELRTKTQHSLDLENISKNTSLVHSRGIKSDSILNRSRFYHVVNNKSLDMMHFVLFTV